jgi:hypothetical protein
MLEQAMTTAKNAARRSTFIATPRVVTGGKKHAVDARLASGGKIAF